MAMDSIGQDVKVGDLVVYNLSGSLALGRVLGFDNGGGKWQPTNYRIRLLQGNGMNWMNKDKSGFHVSKVRYHDNVLKITSRGDFEERFGNEREGEGSTSY